MWISDPAANDQHLACNSFLPVTRFIAWPSVLIFQVASQMSLPPPPPIIHLSEATWLLIYTFLKLLECEFNFPSIDHVNTYPKMQPSMC